MIVNMEDLLEAVPIVGMVGRKMTEHGVSYGLSEAGYDIRIKQPVMLNNMRRFALASAIEEFNMPRDLVGIVHDKSTWARQGLSVFNTVIEPGWKGFLTLELVYHGQEVLIIPAGAGIAQVVFHKTTRDAAYSGKYQGQADRPVEAIRS
ncbi:Dcd Deoxycytidine deaminase [uncultured Caudovirales phage]|uniref:Dcd Deoxycytidine deaminase n=1 Tax=uncultured Caudovirales phage TaxID=2100421 RepID=A0A6J5KVV9_9CAUD|nr:Dcd Deoxycytidine deaminase [uncultured Caudovirales phage]